MELQEFITQTIREIVDGVIEAQTLLPESHTDLKLRPNATVARKTLNVHFDIEVAQTESKEGKGGIAVALPFINAGGEKDRTSEESTRNKISFDIPVSLPIVCGKGE